MFFGLCNSPATFQAMMDDIFGDMINKCIIIVYMDDIFIFAPDEATLTENTKRVLKQLQDNNLFLKPTKCEFNKTKVEYLGWLLKKERSLWIQESSKEFGTGQHQLRSNKLEGFQALEISTNNSFEDFKIQQNH